MSLLKENKKFYVYFSQNGKTFQPKNDKFYVKFYDLNSISPNKGSITGGTEVFFI